MNLTYRRCSNCNYWHSDLFNIIDSVVVSVCEKKQVQTKGSDNCGQWAKPKYVRSYDVFSGEFDMVRDYS